MGSLGMLIKKSSLSLNCHPPPGPQGRGGRAGKRRVSPCWWFSDGRGRGAGGRTTQKAAWQPAQERGFSAAVTCAQQGDAFPRTEEAYPACVNSNTARLTKLSSPYPAAGQRSQGPSGPTYFGKIEREPGRRQPQPSETPERDAATGLITSSDNERRC